MKRIIVEAIIPLLLLGAFSNRAAAQPGRQENISEIQRLLKLLSPQHRGGMIYAPSPRTRARTARALLRIAHDSQAGKEMVIRALIDFLSRPNSQLDGYAPAWYTGAEVLGELKAVEAIDVLTKNIDYTDGIVGLSLAHAPAVKALIQIGQIAVPRIAEILTSGGASLDGSNALKRENAARALGCIGGARARAALEMALSTENDKVVIFYIKVGLQSGGC